MNARVGDRVQRLDGRAGTLPIRGVVREVYRNLASILLDDGTVVLALARNLKVIDRPVSLPAIEEVL